MAWLPGWDSIASGHWWSNFYFAASIVALIFLGVFEAVSHHYSERKDEIAAAEQSDTQRRHDEEIARLHADTEASKTETAKALAQAAEAQLRLEELRKDVRGREITDEQHDQVIAKMIGKPIPNLITRVVNDPEAIWYALSIISVFQELGMKGEMIFLQGEKPQQTGVMFCGAGEEYKDLMHALMDAKIVGVGHFGPMPEEFQRSYCPDGSLFVGLRNPLSTPRPLPPRKDN